MKKLLAMALAASMAVSLFVPAAASETEGTTEALTETAAAEISEDTGSVKRAILDTDMGYLNDDAIVMFMLAQADSLGMCDFLGVTTVGGNSGLPPGLRRLCVSWS